MEDYKKFSNLEQYLFTEVKNNFKKNGFLTPYEFFCIVIWKSNRSKGYIKKKISRKGKDINNTIKMITSELFNKNSLKEKLEHLLSRTGCNLSLPMASAILTVLYPEDFTVYDYRVCDMLGKFHNLKNKTKFEDIWNGYLEFKKAVIKAVANEHKLRNKDHWLWGKSFFTDLNNFVNT